MIPAPVGRIPNADDPSRQAATISSGQPVVQYGKPSQAIDPRRSARRPRPACHRLPAKEVWTNLSSVIAVDIIYHDLCKIHIAELDPLSPLRPVSILDPVRYRQGRGRILADLGSGGSRLSTCGVPIVGWQWTKVSAESARLNWRLGAGGRPVCRTPEMLAEPGTG